MTSHPSLDDARERAALYALGALRNGELRELEAHLREGCAVCAAEVKSFAGVVNELGHAAAPERPRDAVRARVLERARQSVLANQAVVEKDDVRFVRTAQLVWEHGNAPGIEIKVLSVDAERSYVTQLVRMPPGCALRPHRHLDVEESYVLEGDLLVSGVLMGPGDYCRAEPGSLHTGIETRGGCLFIAVSSQRDELLA